MPSLSEIKKRTERALDKKLYTLLDVKDTEIANLKDILTDVLAAWRFGESIHVGFKAYDRACAALTEEG